MDNIWQLTKNSTKLYKGSRYYILLEYPIDVCLGGATTRVGVKRDDMPWMEESLNEEFKQKIISFSEEKLPEIYKLLRRYQEDKNIIFLSLEKKQAII